MLGNPPWDVQQFSDDEFFSVHDPRIAALSGAKRKEAISRSGPTARQSGQYENARNLSDKRNGFCRHSARYSLSTKGKLNSYALFTETALK